MDKSKLVSFVIPCFNGENFVECCLNSIIAQKLPPGFKSEIILVDNNSTDGSVSLVKSNFANHVKVLPQPIQGRPHARNLGAANAQGDYLCFVDVDVELDQNWFITSYEAIQKNPDWSIVSTIIRLKSSDDSWFEKWRISMPPVQTVNTILRINRFSPCLNTAATIIKRDLFNKVGGFDVHFDYFEDIDIARRIGMLEHPIITAPAIAYCYSGMNAITYLKRYYLIGRMSSVFIYKWNDKSYFLSKIIALIHYGKYFLSRISLRFRIDFMFYMMLVHFMAFLGALAGCFRFIKIDKAQVTDKSFVKIIDKEQIVWITLKTGKFRILDLRRFVNPYGRNYRKES